MLKIIEGTKNKKKVFLNQKYYDLYLDYQYGFENIIDIKKAAYYGVKYVKSTNVDALSYQQLLKTFTEIQDIEFILSTLTFNEIINIFPIIKDYDGKGEMKDYYSTMEYLSDKILSEPINNIDEFLWNYYNNDIMNFNIKKMLIFDRLMKFENQPGLLEQMLDKLDPEGNVHTYIYNKEHNYMQDTKTGKTFKVRRPIPKGWKIIK